jgi:hypothetical protein
MWLVVAKFSAEEIQILRLGMSLSTQILVILFLLIDLLMVSRTEATHIILTIVAPGITKPGGRCTQSVSLLDIYPTLIDVYGLSARSELEEESLLPLLKNPQAIRVTPAITTYGRNNHSVRSEQWRYTRGTALKNSMTMFGRNQAT